MIARRACANRDWIRMMLDYPWLELGVHRRRRHVGHKAVTIFRYGLDKCRSFRLLAEYSAKHPDVLSEAVLLDKRIGPHLLKKFFFRYQSTLILEQYKQSLKGFGGNRNRLVAVVEDVLAWIQPKC